MRGERYQITLIALGVITTLMLVIFLYRELFPEYKIYQDDYVALETFRASYSGEPPVQFTKGVKQIVFEREDKGPATVDRCISCHVAEELPHFSPTKIAYDVNGNIVRDAAGIPVKVVNEDYVWAKLDQKIAALTDAETNEQLRQKGENAHLKARLNEAQRLESLKTARVGEHVYDVTKVLQMHPLIGKETRPFEFHPIEVYGCTSCHNGNGKGLTTDKAHGPVFDGEYEAEYMGPMPQFIEQDSKNDPQFAHVFNHKPGDSLLFQTAPILVGGLIQASCVQCHEQSREALQGLAETAGSLTANKQKGVNAIKQGFVDEKAALLSLIDLKLLLESRGYSATINEIGKQLSNPSLSAQKQKALTSQLAFLEKAKSQESTLQSIDQALTEMLGSKKLAEALEQKIETVNNSTNTLDEFLEKWHENPEAKGTLFVKWVTLNLQQSILKHIEDTQQSLSQATSDGSAVSSMRTDIDWLTKNYQRGKELYLSQACYACHKIADMARGGVGPELTHSGDNYPWYLKRKMIWPQGDLSTSTMPNLHLDHIELEDLMSFLLAQKGPTKTVSETQYKIAVQEWEEGKKMPWEKPIAPSQVHDLRFAMTVFATQGCAACHRLQGFESDVGFRIEKAEKPSFDDLYQEHQWFQKLFPEEVQGSTIVSTIEKHAGEIDQHIVDHVRQNSILEEIDTQFPETIESLYANFRYASRAKNNTYEEIAKNSKDPNTQKEAMQKLEEWKKRIHRILMMYVQEYGLGHLIGPRPNWSGVFRSDEWLMEHFYNPTGHVPKSIMPIMPFDDTKFYALTYMLDVLGKRNRDAVHAIWEHKGFNPEQAFQIHCQQCHGEFLQGNGPVAEWIYPIPKNLRSAEFLRNLTKEVATHSITHGIKGTPMPPWGETPEDKENYDGIPVLSAEEIARIVDWLYFSIPGGRVIKGSQDVPKWQYTPKDILEELYREGNRLEGKLNHKNEEAYPQHTTSKKALNITLEAIGADRLYAALNPQVPETKKEGELVSAIFDVRPNPNFTAGDETSSYYIKPKYYTPENLKDGKNFFEFNCAVCHGAEADGSSIRASVMFEAKPRMLTNLDWLNTRDDLRLLRSIKYGVPGTAMTPWGDLTSSLQRLQLVMFIRSLSSEKEQRETLATAIFKAFDTADINIEKARASDYAAFEKLQKKYEDIQKKQKEAYELAQSGQKPLQVAVDLYKQQLELAEQVIKNQLQDQLLVDLKNLVAQQQEIYLSIGNDIIVAGINSSKWKTFLSMIDDNSQRFQFSQNTLNFTLSSEHEHHIQAAAQELAASLDDSVANLEKELAAIQGELPSVEKTERLKSIQAKIATYKRIKSKLLSGVEKSSQLTMEAQQLYKKFQAQQTEMEKQDNK